MKKEELEKILGKVRSGELNIDEAVNAIKLEPFQDIGYANVDTQRELRQGIPEVIYGAGKNAAQIDGIVRTMWETGQRLILITRLSKHKADALSREFPFTYYPDERIGIVGQMPKPSTDGRIVVVTGGTSDYHVAEEAALTAEAVCMM